MDLPLDLGDGMVVYPSLWQGEVRVEYHDGKHSLYHTQFIEALRWFEQGG
jgi:hypothetical protein